MHVDWREGCLPFVPCVLCGEIEIKFARQLGSMGTSYTYTYTLLDPLGVTVRTRGTASAAFLFFFGARLNTAATYRDEIFWSHRSR